MTVVKETTTPRWIGDTADTKPTGVPVGSTYLDRQTGALYVTYDGTNWFEWDRLVKLVAGTSNIGDVDEAPVACAAADVHAPAANTAAVVTYAAVAAVKHVITGIAWSYAGGIPTGGNLKLEDVSGTTVFSMDITDQGAGFILFPKPKKAAAVNTAMIVTLAAGGAGVTGKASVVNHWTEA